MTENLEDKDAGLRAQVTLLLTWRQRAIRATVGHYYASSFYRVFSTFFTCFNLLAAIAVLFLTNNRVILEHLKVDYSLALDWWIAGSSLIVVLTTALQYVLQLDQRSKDHKSAGNEFTHIKRTIETHLIAERISEYGLREISLLHNHASKNYPLVPNLLWKISTRKMLPHLNSDLDFDAAIRSKFELSRASQQSAQM